MKAILTPRKELNEQYYRFWDELLRKARHKTHVGETAKAMKTHWIKANIVSRGISYCYSIEKDRIIIELFINNNGPATANRAIFDQIKADKNANDAKKGESQSAPRLTWEREHTSPSAPDASRIWMKVMDRTEWQDESNWPRIQDSMIDAMVRFEDVLMPYVA